MKQSLIDRRLEKAKDELTKKGLDAVLVSSVPNITYLTNFSNFSNFEREAYLFITKSEQYIITDGRYSETIAFHVPHFTLIERTTTRTFGTIFTEFVEKQKIKRLGIEEDNISVSEQKLLKKYFNDIYHFSITSLRSLKDKDEINAIEKACQLGDKTYSNILKNVRIGISEKKLAFELEKFIKKQGADLSFPTIVAFGKNSSVPHHQTSNKRLEARDQIVLLDFGVKLNNYCSDMTRTVFFGKPTNEQKKMYNTVLEAQQKAMQQLNNETMKQSLVKASDIDRVARQYIEQQGFPSIPHSLGHGIGLEVHESPRLGPRSKDVLKPGMVFSIEPGIYLPGFGGIRIEDLVVIESSGPRFLTKSATLILQEFPQ